MSAGTDDPRGLVGTTWLAECLGDAADDLRVLDATWFLPTVQRDARQEYAAAHIPGAVYFDIDRIADPDSPLPHMLPSAERFAAEVGALGIGDGDQVVVYDNNGFSASARAWWMFRVFGHDRVAVLDGGLGRWRAEGRPVDDQPVTPSPRRFTPRPPRLELVRDLAAMLDNVPSRREQVVDARSRGRFEGTAPEPRPGLRSGRIPGSANLPYNELVAPDGTMLGPERLRERFAAAGVDPGRPVATTCGSGVSACVLGLALHRIGNPNAAVYDGSWTEWGGRADTPVEAG